MMPSPASSPWIRRYPMTRSPALAGAPPTAQCGAPAAGRNVPGGTTAPAGGGQGRGASAKSWLGSRSAATGPSARPAASRRATPATPGPATSTVNVPSAARAGPPRADGAASGSQRPSTTPPAATSRAQIWSGSRRGRSASSPQAEDHHTPARTKTSPPGTVHVTEPAASPKASAQVARVFGTHREQRTPDGGAAGVRKAGKTPSWRDAYWLRGVTLAASRPSAQLAAGAWE
jgi:hypothetical protein